MTTVPSRESNPLAGINGDYSPPEPDIYGLAEHEEWWRDHYEMLRKHGYELRPRLRPGWKPSWTGKKIIPELCEDGIPSLHPKTIDARRLSDGRRVKIKKLVKGRGESDLALFLSNEEFREDPRNHCVPILDVFSEEGHLMEFMVMPLLLKYDTPPFSSVEEVLDFVRQTIEGLSFIHEKGVAHRDCSILNIMMEGDCLYSKGFHPGTWLLDASGKHTTPRRRRDTSGIKYYFTDFGISTRFQSTEHSQLVTGIDGQDEDVPELHKPEPYDPFAVDIFILGNLFRKTFTDEYENLAFLKPLVERMTEIEPSLRPSISQAIDLFNELIRKQRPRELRWDLIFDDSSKFERFVWNANSIRREALFLTTSLLPFSLKKRKKYGF